MTSTITTHNIAEDGDVFFEVGEPVTTRLRVSSKVLAAASKYFAVLFGPQFREGRTLLTHDTATIPIPDDRALAVTDLRNLLHGRNVPELVAPNVEAERIYDLSIVVDKYGCIETLSLQSRGLVLGFLCNRETLQSDDTAIAHITAAAFLFDLSTCFRMATSLLVKNCVKPIHLVFAGDIGNRLPSNMLLALASKRERAYNLISYCLPKVVEEFCPVEGGDHSDDLIRSLCEKLQVRFWPPDLVGGDLSVDTVIERLAGLDLEQIVSSSNYRYENSYMEEQRALSGIASKNKELRDRMKESIVERINQGRNAARVTHGYQLILLPGKDDLARAVNVRILEMDGLEQEPSENRGDSHLNVNTLVGTAGFLPMPGAARRQ